MTSRRIGALVAKDFRILRRDSAALLFLLLAPIVVISVAGLSLSTFYGGWRRAEIAYLLPVIDHDESEVSEELISSLEETEDLRLVMVDEEEARRLVSDTNQAGAALIIPEGFGAGLRKGDEVNLLLWTDPVKHIEVLRIRSEVQRLQAGLVALQVAGRIAVVEVLTYAGEVDYEAVSEDARKLAGRLIESSVGLEEVSLTSSRTHFNTFDQNVPGFGVTFLMLGTLLGVGLGLVDEKEWGTLQRVAASPVPPSSLVVGKLLSRVAVGVVQMVILFAFGRVVFAVSLGGSLLGMGLVILGAAFAAAAFGLLVAALAPSRDSVLPLGTIAIMSIVAVGGCWWPITMEPPWLQKLAHLFPPAWIMGAFNDMMLREKGLVDIWPALVALAAFGVAFLAAGVQIYLRRQERMQ